MKKIVLAISREYGSGGNTTARKLAAELGIPLYDKAIIEMAAEKSGLSTDYLNSVEQNITSSYLFNLVSSSYSSNITAAHQYDVPISYTAFTAQANVIHELAARGSCVILGRCADYILREDPDCVKVFIHADRAFRAERSMADFGLSFKDTESRLAKIDKNRASYYKNFTGSDWGNARAYDLCINTTRCGADGAIAAIKDYLRGAGILD